jgi:hypothetical protein
LLLIYALSLPTYALMILGKSLVNPFFCTGLPRFYNFNN